MESQMKNVYSKSIMASYATFKELYNSKKYSSPYQILAEFIKYIIVSKTLYTFTSTEIQGFLIDEFGFNLPLAVVRTAIKNISEVSLNNRVYNVSSQSIQSNKDFCNYKQKSEDQSKIITDALIEYAEEKNVILDKARFVEELIAYMLDEEGDSQYQQIISEFILSNNNNELFTDSFSAIRDGSILYSGLAFNITEFGSLNQKLTLFLDTEILFDIAGLNGEFYKALAIDFFRLVEIANKNSKTITLKYFKVVADEIDQFYGQAERIVSGQGEIFFSQAMTNIISGCKDISDISDKKVEFYDLLHSKYSILQDDKKNYYTDSDYEYNLEGMSCLEFPNTEEANREGYLFCSHINKLRKGNISSDYLSSNVLFITDTRRVLEISRSITEQMNSQDPETQICDYAVSLSKITNLLWYKLNRGFGSTQFPENLDVIIKARVILSSYINQNISNTYKNIKEKVKSGELSQEQAAARIVALKEKSIPPENITQENIDDVLNFTEEHLCQFEESQAQNRRLLIEQNKTIENLSNSVEDLQKRLSESERKNSLKQQQIDNLSQKIQSIEEKEKQKENNKKVFKERFKLVLKIGWKIFLIIAIIVGSVIVSRIYKIDLIGLIGTITGIVGIIPMGWSIWKRDVKKYKEIISQNNKE